jgi:tetratricopeptide (TPR) repeat protein
MSYDFQQIFNQARQEHYGLLKNKGIFSNEFHSINLNGAIERYLSIINHKDSPAKIVVGVAVELVNLWKWLQIPSSLSDDEYFICVLEAELRIKFAYYLTLVVNISRLQSELPPEVGFVLEEGKGLRFKGFEVLFNNNYGITISNTASILISGTQGYLQFLQDLFKRAVYNQLEREALIGKAIQARKSFGTQGIGELQKRWGYAIGEAHKRLKSNPFLALEISINEKLQTCCEILRPVLVRPLFPLQTYECDPIPYVPQSIAIVSPAPTVFSKPAESLDFTQLDQEEAKYKKILRELSTGDKYLTAFYYLAVIHEDGNFPPQDSSITQNYKAAVEYYKRIADAPQPTTLEALIIYGKASYALASIYQNALGTKYNDTEAPELESWNRMHKACHSLKSSFGDDSTYVGYVKKYYGQAISIKSKDLDGVCFTFHYFSGDDEDTPLNVANSLPSYISLMKDFEKNYSDVKDCIYARERHFYAIACLMAFFMFSLASKTHQTYLSKKNTLVFEKISMDDIVDLAVWCDYNVRPYAGFSWSELLTHLQTKMINLWPKQNKRSIEQDMLFLNSVRVRSPSFLGRFSHVISHFYLLHFTSLLDNSNFSNLLPFNNSVETSNFFSVNKKTKLNAELLHFNSIFLSPFALDFCYTFCTLMAIGYQNENTCDSAIFYYEELLRVYEKSIELQHRGLSESDKKTINIVGFVYIRKNECHYLFYAHFQLGELYQNQGDFQKAYHHYNEALKIPFKSKDSDVVSAEHIVLYKRACCNVIDLLQSEKIKAGRENIQSYGDLDSNADKKASEPVTKLLHFTERENDWPLCYKKENNSKIIDKAKYAELRDERFMDVIGFHNATPKNNICPECEFLIRTTTKKTDLTKEQKDFFENNSEIAILNSKRKANLEGVLNFEHLNQEYGKHKAKAEQTRRGDEYLKAVYYLAVIHEEKALRFLNVNVPPQDSSITQNYKAAVEYYKRIADAPQPTTLEALIIYGKASYALASLYQNALGTKYNDPDAPELKSWNRMHTACSSLKSLIMGEKDCVDNVRKYYEQAISINSKDLDGVCFTFHYLIGVGETERELNTSRGLNAEKCFPSYDVLIQNFKSIYVDNCFYARERHFYAVACLMRHLFQQPEKNLLSKDEEINKDYFNLFQKIKMNDIIDLAVWYDCNDNYAGFSLQKLLETLAPRKIFLWHNKEFKSELDSFAKSRAKCPIFGRFEHIVISCYFQHLSVFFRSSFVIPPGEILLPWDMRVNGVRKAFFESNKNLNQINFSKFNNIFLLPFLLIPYYNFCNWMAQGYLEAGISNLAILCYEELLTVYKKSIEFQHDKESDSINSYDYRRQTELHHLFYAHFELGELYQNQSDCQKAYNHYKEALKIPFKYKDSDVVTDEHIELYKQACGAIINLLRSRELKIKPENRYDIKYYEVLSKSNLHQKDVPKQLEHYRNIHDSGWPLCYKRHNYERISLEKKYAEKQEEDTLDSLAYHNATPKNNRCPECEFLIETNLQLQQTNYSWGTS